MYHDNTSNSKSTYYSRFPRTKLQFWYYVVRTDFDSDVANELTATYLKSSKNAYFESNDIICPTGINFYITPVPV